MYIPTVSKNRMKMNVYCLLSVVVSFEFIVNTQTDKRGEGFCFNPQRKSEMI